jgi:RES domain-containing protein
LIDLVGVAARAFGLDQRIGTVLEYGVCQEWARALYERYPSSHGLRWRGRQAGSVCVVLNDRVDMGSLELITDYPISHPKVWNQIGRAGRRARLEIVAP